MSIVKNVGRLAQLSARQITTSSAAASEAKMEVHEGYKRLKEIQKKYQADDGLPVHLKRGASDRALMYLTFVGCGVGLVGIAQADDGRPVHLKRGASDRALMYLTFIGCGVGVGGMLKLFYDLS